MDAAEEGPKEKAGEDAAPELAKLSAFGRLIVGDPPVPKGDEDVALVVKGDVEEALIESASGACFAIQHKRPAISTRTNGHVHPVWLRLHI